jgi:RNA polymerase sigma-70 factor (ECF subfamily)
VPGESEKRDWAGFAKGEPDIWREFINRQIPLLFNMFMKRWPNPSLAEELVQRSIFDAVRGLGGYDPLKGSPEEWLFGIARNNIRLEIRKRAARPTANGGISRYLQKIDTEPLPDEILERKETAETVRLALSRLKSKEQAVLRAKYTGGLMANEIARQMHTTEKAVLNLLYRAKISLRRELKLIKSS